MNKTIAPSPSTITRINSTNDDILSLLPNYKRFINDHYKLVISEKWSLETTLNLLDLISTSLIEISKFEWSNISNKLNISEDDCKSRYEEIEDEFKKYTKLYPDYIEVEKSIELDILDNAELNQSMTIEDNTELNQSMVIENKIIEPSSPVRPIRINMDPSSPIHTSISVPLNKIIEEPEPSDIDLKDEKEVLVEENIRNADDIESKKEKEVFLIEENIKNADNIENEKDDFVENSINKNDNLTFMELDDQNVESQDEVTDDENESTNEMEEDINKSEDEEVAEAKNNEEIKKDASGTVSSADDEEIVENKVELVVKEKKKKKEFLPRMLTERQQLALLLNQTKEEASIPKKKERKNAKGSKPEKEKAEKSKDRDVDETPKKKSRAIEEFGKIWLPDDFDEWPVDRQKAWKKVPKNPDDYYMMFSPPGVNLKTSKWTAKEKDDFIEALRTRPHEDKWGLFSMNFPGRTGTQCKQFYEQLERQGELPKEVVPEPAPQPEKKKRGRKKKVVLETTVPSSSSSSSSDADDNEAEDTEEEDDLNLKKIEFRAKKEKELQEAIAKKERRDREQEEKRARLDKEKEEINSQRELEKEENQKKKAKELEDANKNKEESLRRERDLSESIRKDMSELMRKEREEKQLRKEEVKTPLPIILPLVSFNSEISTSASSPAVKLPLKLGMKIPKKTNPFESVTVTQVATPMLHPPPLTPALSLSINNAIIPNETPFTPAQGSPINITKTPSLAVTTSEEDKKRKEMLKESFKELMKDNIVPIEDMKRKKEIVDKSETETDEDEKEADTEVKPKVEDRKKPGRPKKIQKIADKVKAEKFETNKVETKDKMNSDEEDDDGEESFKLNLLSMLKPRYARHDITSPFAQKQRFAILSAGLKRSESTSNSFNEPFVFTSKTMEEERVNLRVKFIADGNKLMDHFFNECLQLSNRIHNGGLTKFHNLMNACLQRYHRNSYKAPSQTFSYEKIKSMFNHLVEDFERAKNELAQSQRLEATTLRNLQYNMYAYENDYPETLEKHDGILPPLVPIADVKMKIPEEFESHL